MSENLLKEICNKVLSLFKQTESKEETKNVACNRLRVVLMQDRTNLTPELLQRMRKELVELLSKYLEMDKDALELNLEQDGNQMALMLSIPVIRAKEEAEIEKALQEESQEKDNEEKTDEASDEETETSQEDETEVDLEESDSEDEENKETETEDNITEESDEAETAER